MKNNNFRNLCKNYSFCKNAKYAAIVPFVIVLAAIIVIAALGSTSGSYSDAVGIGIDFEGGTILTVTLGEDILNDAVYEQKGNELKNVIEGVEVELYATSRGKRQLENLYRVQIQKRVRRRR